MKFRLKAFGLHLLASATVLSLTLGTLYLGWYRWPGWYLADVPRVVAVMAGVDLVLGPTLTLIIASTKKLRRELTRDIAMIVGRPAHRADLWDDLAVAGTALVLCVFRKRTPDGAGVRPGRR